MSLEAVPNDGQTQNQTKEEPTTQPTGQSDPGPQDQDAKDMGEGHRTIGDPWFDALTADQQKIADQAYGMGSQAAVHEMQQQGWKPQKAQPNPPPRNDWNMSQPDPAEDLSKHWMNAAKGRVLAMNPDDIGEDTFFVEWGKEVLKTIPQIIDGSFNQKVDAHQKVKQETQQFLTAYPGLRKIKDIESRVAARISQNQDPAEIAQFFFDLTGRDPRVPAQTKTKEEEMRQRQQRRQEQFMESGSPGGAPQSEEDAKSEAQLVQAYVDKLWGDNS